MKCMRHQLSTLSNRLDRADMSPQIGLWLVDNWRGSCLRRGAAQRSTRDTKWRCRRCSWCLCKESRRRRWIWFQCSSDRGIGCRRCVRRGSGRGHTMCNLWESHYKLSNPKSISIPKLLDWRRFHWGIKSVRHTFYYWTMVYSIRFCISCSCLPNWCKC
jgi:hypothetical protein